MDLNNVNQLEQTAQDTATQASNDTSTATSAPQMLMDALNKKFADPSNPLIQSRDSALTNYLNAGTTASTKYSPENSNGAVYSPTQRRALEGEYETSASVPLFSVQDLISRAYGGITNIGKTVGDLFTAQAKSSADRASLARTAYEDAYKQYSDEQSRNLQLQLENMRIAATANKPTKQNLIDQLRQDIVSMSGLTNAGQYDPNLLKDVFAKYSGNLAPKDILATYNASVNPAWGPARLSGQNNDLSFLQSQGLDASSASDMQRLHEQVGLMAQAGRSADDIRNYILSQGYSPYQFEY